MPSQDYLICVATTTDMWYNITYKGVVVMEEWKNIIGYDNYEISSCGRVKSTKYSNVYIQKQRLTKDGYVKATLTINSKAKEFTIHRLVAKYFIDNPLNLETVNHKNGMKTDNNVANLEWMDRHSQLQHAYNMGLKKPMQGINNANSKLSSYDIKYIREHYMVRSQEFGTVALGLKFGVDNSIIGKVVKGKTYKNIK